MDEVVSNTVFSFSKKDVLRHGLRRALEPSVEALCHNTEDGFVDLVDSNLQEEDNQYQFTLTIKKFEKVEEPAVNEEETAA